MIVSNDRCFFQFCGSFAVRIGIENWYQILFACLALGWRESRPELPNRSVSYVYRLPTRQSGGFYRSSVSFGLFPSFCSIRFFILFSTRFYIRQISSQTNCSCSLQLKSREPTEWRTSSILIKPFSVKVCNGESVSIIIGMIRSGN